MKEQNQVEKQQKKQGRKRRNEPKHAEKSNELFNLNAKKSSKTKEICYFNRV